MCPIIDKNQIVMKELIQYTDEFDFFDPTKPYNESSYNILIKHDNSKESINDKFIISLLNTKNEIVNKISINTWCITEIGIFDYYDRAKVKIETKDPKGTNLPAFESGGFSLYAGEEDNIEMVKEKLTDLLKRVLQTSFFLDYRSRLDYINQFRKEHPDQEDLYNEI
jgi:hypothetical protein